MKPEHLAQWRNDAARMREFLHSPEWTILRRHLEEARDQALRHGDLQPPDKVDEVMHWRAVRLGIVDALALPETIIAQADRLDAQAKAEAARARPAAFSRSQKGSR